MVVDGAEHFEEGDRGCVRLNALPRAVRHIDNRYAAPADGVDFGAFGNEIQDHRVIAA